MPKAVDSISIFMPEIHPLMKQMDRRIQEIIYTLQIFQHNASNTYWQHPYSIVFANAIMLLKEQQESIAPFVEEPQLPLFEVDRKRYIKTVRDKFLQGLLALHFSPEEISRATNYPVVFLNKLQTG